MGDVVVEAEADCETARVRPIVCCVCGVVVIIETEYTLLGVLFFLKSANFFLKKETMV